MNTFENELTALINRYSMENESNTPDFILARYLEMCLSAYNETVAARARWYDRMDTPGGPRTNNRSGAV
jgi:hypothetical protein